MKSQSESWKSWLGNKIILSKSSFLSHETAVGSFISTEIKEKSLIKECKICNGLLHFLSLAVWFVIITVFLFNIVLLMWKNKQITTKTEAICVI